MLSTTKVLRSRLANLKSKFAKAKCLSASSGSISEVLLLSYLHITPKKDSRLKTNYEHKKDAPSQSWRVILQVYRGNEWDPARLCSWTCSLFDVHK